jgi:hypothetical protein
MLALLEALQHGDSCNIPSALALKESVWWGQSEYLSLVTWSPKEAIFFSPEQTRVSEKNTDVSKIFAGGVLRNKVVKLSSVRRNRPF